MNTKSKLVIVSLTLAACLAAVAQPYMIPVGSKGTETAWWVGSPGATTISNYQGWMTVNTNFIWVSNALSSLSGGSQTPWTSDIDAADHNLLNFGNVLSNGSGGLTIAMGGDQYGGVSLFMANRDGQNGCFFSNNDMPLVDFGFQTSASGYEYDSTWYPFWFGHTLRLEQRDGGILNSLNQFANGGYGEFQFQTRFGTETYAKMGAASSSFNGRVGIAMDSPNYTLYVGGTFACDNASIYTDGSGNMTCVSLTESSDAMRKERIQSFDASGLLDRIKAVPVKRWRFAERTIVVRPEIITKTNRVPAVRRTLPASIEHVGPMAQDWSAQFGGATNGICVTDALGVLLAAVQELAAENRALRARIVLIESRR